MNVDIRKISNGYILKLGDKEAFYDVPEAICGALAEWALAMCKRLDSGGAGGDAAMMSPELLAKMLAQVEVQTDKSVGASLVPNWMKIIR